MEENPLTVVATLLDPRYKTAAFQNKENSQKGKEKLLSLVISELNRAAAEEVHEATVAAKLPDLTDNSEKVRKYLEIHSKINT